IGWGLSALSAVLLFVLLYKDHAKRTAGLARRAPRRTGSHRAVLGHPSDLSGVCVAVPTQPRLRRVRDLPGVHVLPVLAGLCVCFRSGTGRLSSGASAGGGFCRDAVAGSTRRRRLSDTGQRLESRRTLASSSPGAAAEPARAQLADEWHHHRSARPTGE